MALTIAEVVVAVAGFVVGIAVVEGSLAVVLVLVSFVVEVASCLDAILGV